MGESASYTAESIAYAAIKGGPNVFFDYGWDDTVPDVLYVCGTARCEGSFPSDRDPLAQYPCAGQNPHFCWKKGTMVCPHYKPVVLDVFAAQEELNIHPSARYQHMWGHDTDDEEEVVFD
jgi:hypothetical protein